MIRFPLQRSPEKIGHVDCPLIHRWTVVTWGDGSRKSTSEAVPESRGGKLLVHHFLSHADDRHVHDHPRGFWTLVLWGRYDDMAPCPKCEGDGEEPLFDVARHDTFGWRACTRCTGSGVILRERMTFGKLRYRPATHQHRTQVGPNGCWTIVVMGRLERPWGFWRGGEWLEWRAYQKRYGAGMRCD